MIRILSEALKRELDTDRLIAEINGEAGGPVFIFTAGLHGNEPTGVFALKDVFDEINASGVKFRGKAIALAGNMRALHENKRFVKEDLNRMWTIENIKQVRNGFDPEQSGHPELAEMYELYRYLDVYFNNISEEEYFIDLHTTSAPTRPFIALSNINDNLRFARQFAVPVISNIDKYLKAPMLAYANHTGDQHVSLAFEAGQHHREESLENHKNFIRLCFNQAGCFIDPGQFDAEETGKKLYGDQSLSGHFEIIHHYLILPGESFRMKPGFSNFQEIEKGELLAESNGEIVKAPSSGRIFMPLYQSQGNDGFFIIREAVK